MNIRVYVEFDQVLKEVINVYCLMFLFCNVIIIKSLSRFGSNIVSAVTKIC